MSEQRYIKYGDRTMLLEPGMTLDQAKELMRRHFPELSDPKIETKKDGDKTTYVFTKQAGHKGSSRHAQNDIAQIVAGLTDLQSEDTHPGVEAITRLIDAGFRTTAGLDASPRGVDALSKACDGLVEEGERVIQLRGDLLELPGLAMGGSVL